MKFRYLYRYEDQRGLGPYRKDSPISDTLKGAHWNLPTIFRDLRTDNTEGLYCACSSLYSLNEWFNGFQELLKDNYYDIYKYKVTKYTEGNSGKQVFFSQDSVIWKKKIN